MKIQMLPTDKIIPYVNNPKAHPEGQVKKLAGAIAEFKWDQPIVVDKDMVVIKGHGRLMAAQALGLKTVPVVVADYLTPAQAKAARIQDNRMAESEWFPEALSLELKALEEMDFDLGLTGFDLEELEAMGIGGSEGDPAPEDPGPQIDRAAELQEKWGTARGQIWEISSLSTPGKAHRVMCGDSTSAEDVGRLMGGQKAILCLTDPPYGIGEAYKTFDDSEQNLMEVINQFLPLAREISKTILLTSGVKNRKLYPEPDWILCWFVAAGTGVGPWGFNCWQPILAYGKDPYLAKGLGSRPDAMTMTEAGDNKLGHPCSKPIGVWSWIMERGSTEKGHLIYDPFLGSGTTLIAAEQLGRVCFGMEIDPGYTAVILERALGIGLEPKLIESVK